MSEVPEPYTHTHREGQTRESQTKERERLCAWVQTRAIIQEVAVRPWAVGVRPRALCTHKDHAHAHKQETRKTQRRTRAGHSQWVPREIIAKRTRLALSGAQARAAGAGGDALYTHAHRHNETVTLSRKQTLAKQTSARKHAHKGMKCKQTPSLTVAGAGVVGAARVASDPPAALRSLHTRVVRPPTT